MTPTLLGRLLCIGPLIALLLVLILAIVSYKTTTTLVTDFGQVRHYREVHTDLINLLSAVKDPETGQRGYIITGTVEYLAPYTSARTTVAATLDALQALTVDEPSQQRQLNALRPIIAAKLTELDQTVTLRRTQDLTQVAAVVSADQG